MLDCNNTTDKAFKNESFLQQPQTNGDSNPTLTIVLFGIIVILLFLIPTCFEFWRRFRRPASVSFTQADVTSPVEGADECASKIDNHMSRFTMVLEEKHFNCTVNDAFDSNQTQSDSLMTETKEKGLPSKMLGDSEGNFSKDFDADHSVEKPRKLPLLERMESGFIFIALQNESMPPAEIEKRHISESCAICINSYRVGDIVTWSSNPLCMHVFHRACIETWLLKERAHLQCPCCRQRFVDGMLDLEKGAA